MNILPKKNWHVRKKENIARVRKDEAEAAEIEKEKERRAKLAEQEARITFLRNRAKERFQPEGHESLEIDSKETEQSNFTSKDLNFSEDEIQKTGTNKEYEEEKKNEKEDYEKKIGLLTYLGQDSHEARGCKPWFEDGGGFMVKNRINIEQDEEVGMKGKLKLDPLKDIIKYTDVTYHQSKRQANSKLSKVNIAPVSHETTHLIKKKLQKEKKRKRRRSSDTEDEKPSKRKKTTKSHRKTHKRKKSKKNKHKKHKTRRDSSPSMSDNDEKAIKAAQLSKLREERLKREAVERKRAERLLAGKDPDTEELSKEEEKPFKQKYNSQFNPHLAKQNFERLNPDTKYWLQ